jgi:hypothetical protein
MKISEGAAPALTYTTLKYCVYSATNSQKPRKIS